MLVLRFGGTERFKPHDFSRCKGWQKWRSMSPKLTLYCTLITCVAIAEMPCAAGNRNWHNVGHMGLQRAGLTASPS